MRVVVAMLAALPATAAERRLVLLPIEALGVDAARAAELSAATARCFSGRSDIALLAAPGDTPADCASAERCVATVLRATDADAALAIGVASLGDTHVVRVRVLEARAGAATRELRESVLGDQATLVTRLMELVRQLVPPRAAPPAAALRVRWGVLAAVIATVGSAIALPLLLSSDHERRYQLP